MPWIARLRLRVLAWVTAIGLAALATFSLVNLPWLPIVGFAVALVVSVSKSTSRLDRVTCLQCGQDLSEQPIGQYGVTCHECGSISQPLVFSAERPARRTEKGEA